jgi:glucosyl-dolichyl phosphate glucuronosyltransferase
MTTSVSIGVIIPTYQRPKDALRSLRSLQDQTLESFEAVLVDNDKDPELRNQTEAFNASAVHPVRYVAEARVGLHFGRHAGATCSRADVLVFTDDDATFDAGWLQAYARAFSEHPSMAAAGGPVRPVWETPPPRWLSDWVKRSAVFPILSLMEPYQEFRLGPEGYFFGVNMAVRRDLLFEVGGFNPELIGSRTVGDGESGLNRKLRDRSYHIGYVPEALVHHHIPPHRMTVDYVKKWGWHWGGAQMYERLRGKTITPLRLLAETARVLAWYSPFWALAPLVKKRKDRYSLKALLRSSAGRYQLSYLRWVHSDPQMREYLLQENHVRGNDGEYPVC